MTKLKMKMTVKRYTTTQGKQIHKFAVESMTVSLKFGAVESLGHMG